MYVTVDEYRETWDQIKRESLSHSTCRIVLLVSCLDVDALCAAKILDNLLQKDLIPHKIIPVIGYESFRRAFADLDSDISNVLCVGCGGTVDLQEFLDIGERNIKVHVIDNHRPWNLNNLFSAPQVVCYDDGTISHIEKYKKAYHYLAMHGDGSDSEDEADNDDEDPLDRGGSFTNARAEEDLERHGNREIGSSDASDVDTDEDEQGPAVEQTQVDTNQAVGEDTVPDIPRRDAKKEYVSLLEEYYRQGTHIYSADSILVYTLLAQIGDASARNLWLAVVGETSLEPQHPEVHVGLFPLLRDEIRRLQGDHEPRGASEVSFGVETEYSLFLLRHWSLYESMIHSPYLSARLYLWTDQGRKNLHKMLAKMGISLQESREQWTHMQPMLKKQLKTKFEAVASMYGIDGLIHDGIIRKYGYKGNISASDCSEAIAALIETGNPTFNPLAPEHHQFWVENFWIAWDSAENYDKLVQGMQRAKLLQQAVVATGTAVFEKGQLKDLQTFRLAVIRDGPDIELFRNPLSLARLGVWISEGCAEIHAQPLPLVVAAYVESQELYLVLGMGPRKARDELTTDTVYNMFGLTFQQVADSINAKVRVDAFESAVIEVAKEDLSRFLETLAHARP